MAGRAAAAVDVTDRLGVRLFGPVGVDIDGVNVDLSARQQRATLAVLAMSAGTVVSAQRLIDSLWGEAPPASAKNALQVYVAGLRRALGASSIRTVDPGYRLDVPRDRVDALRFERLVEEQRFADAVALWTADPLSDLVDLPFAGPFVTHLQELRLRCLEGWFDQRLDQGVPDGVSADIEQALVEAPFREKLWRQLMVAHYRCGRQADALTAFARARRVLADDLGIDPGPALVALEAAVLAQDPALDVPTVRVQPLSRVPQPATQTIGRETELAAIADSTRTHRLTTLLGPGGVGKTRLAAEAARDVAHLADGVVWVELAGARDERGFTAQVAAAVGAADSADDGSSIAAALDRREVLVVLDNLEQLAAAGALVSDLLTRTTGPHFLVTSRIPLRVRAEQVVAIDPLTASATQRMLSERILAASGDEPDERVVAELASRLSGFPLAVELTAASSRHMSPVQILRALDDRLPVTSHHADLPERHRTMQATVRWSLDLLDDEARAMLGDLTQFRGAFPSSAVTGPGGSGDDPLAALVEASLLRRRGEDYELLAPVREYLLMQLSETEKDALADRHAAWVVQICADAAAALYGGDEVATRNELVGRLPDVRAAYDHLFRSRRYEEAARVILDITQVWFYAGRLHEAEACLDALNGCPGMTARTAGELRAMQGCFRKIADLPGAPDLLLDGVTRLRGHAPDSIALVNALCHLADLHLMAGDHDQAVALADEAVATASRRVGDWGTASVAWDLAGYIARGVGDRGRAIAAARAAVAEARRDRTGVLPEAVGGLAASLGPEDPEALTVAYEALSLTERPDCPPTQRAKVITDVAAVIAACDAGEAVSLLSEAVSTRLATSARSDLAGLLTLVAAIVTPLEPVAAATLIGSTAAVRTSHFEDIDACANRLREVLDPRTYARAAGAGAALDDDALSRFVAQLAQRVSTGFETAG